MQTRYRTCLSDLISALHRCTLSLADPCESCRPGNRRSHESKRSADRPLRSRQSGPACSARQSRANNERLAPPSGSYAQIFEPGAAHRVHVDDVREIFDIRVEIVVPVSRRRAERFLIRHPLHTGERTFEQFVRARLDPARVISVSAGPPFGGLYFESAIVRWIVQTALITMLSANPAVRPLL